MTIFVFFQYQDTHVLYISHSEQWRKGLI